MVSTPACSPSTCSSRRRGLAEPPLPVKTKADVPIMMLTLKSHEHAFMRRYRHKRPIARRAINSIEVTLFSGRYGLKPSALVRADTQLTGTMQSLERLQPAPNGRMSLWKGGNDRNRWQSTSSTPRVHVLSCRCSGLHNAMSTH